MVFILSFTYRRLTLISAVLSAALLTPVVAHSEPFNKEDCKKQKGVILNFINTDIREVINGISECIGKNILIDPRVNGKVTILSKTPLRKESVYDVFLDALRTHNYIAIEQGDVVKIVPLEEAKQNPPSTSQVIPGGSEQMTRVVKIKNVSAAQLVQVLRPLMPREAYLQAYMDSNTLVLSDSEKNIRRLLKVIEEIDKPNQDKDVIVPLYQANAEDVLKILKESQPKRTEVSATVTADKRSNSIIISGNKGERDRYLKMIKDLDTPTISRSTANHHVIPLKYAKAVDLAPILDKLISGKSAGGSTGSYSSSPTPPPPPSGMSGTSSGSSFGSSLSSGTSSFGSSSAPNNYMGSNVIADEVTNSLIVSADLQAYQSVLTILKELDIPRLQVMIEAIIAEVSFDNRQKLGVQWGVNGNHVGTANTPTSPEGLLGVFSALANSDLTKALLTGGFSALIAKGDIGVMLNAIKNDANVNILSAPQILTLNNKEAQLMVGENIPFPTGQYTQPTGGAATNPFTTIQRQDVGLILKVKPQINQGGMISLEIAQETSSVKDPNNANGPTTTKRSMQSNVLVANGNMLVLGGLMDDKTDDGVDAMPILGDIPLLGWLFKTQTTQLTKRTLMVFIKPTIVDSEALNNPATQKAVSVMEQEQGKINQKTMLLTPEQERYQIAPRANALPELDSTTLKAVGE